MIDTHKKHHCMVVFSPYPIGETRVQREAEILLKNGFKVDVICLQTPGSKKNDDYNGVKIFRESYRLPLPFIKKGSLLEKFLRYIRFFFLASFRLTLLHMRERFTSVQVHNLPDFLVLCAWFPKLQGVPILLDLHDLMPEFFSGRFKNPKSVLFKLILWQERIACKFSDHVITVSDHWKQALELRGVPPSKCSVIMNVADERIFHPVDRSVLSSSTRDSFKLVYHGSIHNRYGLDLVVEAVHRLKDEIPKIHLTLIGGGSSVEMLRQMVFELKLENQVSFLDLVLAENLPCLIGSCNLGIVPYRDDVFTDGLLPTKLMEYAAMGVPAIASSTTAIQAYFQDTLVEFFRPGDVDDLVRCIRFLYQNPARLEELALGCQKFNQQYNWNVVGVRYVRLVESLS